MKEQQTPLSLFPLHIPFAKQSDRPQAGGWHINQYLPESVSRQQDFPAVLSVLCPACNWPAQSLFMFSTVQAFMSSPPSCNRDWHNKWSVQPEGSHRGYQNLCVEASSRDIHETELPVGRFCIQWTSDHESPVATINNPLSHTVGNSALSVLWCLSSTLVLVCPTFFLHCSSSLQ